MNATARFEALNSLYYRATGYLRPGKSEPMETRRDSSSPENRERFEQWLVSHGWTAALDRIVELETEVDALNQRIGDLA
jgi:hypothetical protein